MRNKVNQLRIGLALAARRICLPGVPEDPVEEAVKWRKNAPYRNGIRGFVFRKDLFCVALDV